MVNINAVTPGEHCKPNIVHIASMMLHEKNGTQQIRKTPVKWEKDGKEKKHTWINTYTFMKGRKNSTINLNNVFEEKFFLSFSSNNKKIK